MDSRVLYLDKYNDKKKLHRYIAEVLDFPKYYGANLDALYDVLSDMTEDIKIDIILTNTHNYHALRILEVFKDAGLENPHLLLNTGDAHE